MWILIFCYMVSNRTLEHQQQGWTICTKHSLLGPAPAVCIQLLTLHIGIAHCCYRWAFYSYTAILVWEIVQIPLSVVLHLHGILISQIVYLLLYLYFTHKHLHVWQQGIAHRCMCMFVNGNNLELNFLENARSSNIKKSVPLWTESLRWNVKNDSNFSYTM